MKTHVELKSKEMQLVLVLCRMVLSGVGSLSLNRLLTSPEWKISSSLRKFKLLEQQYEKDFAVASSIQQKYMVQTRTKNRIDVRNQRLKT